MHLYRLMSVTCAAVLYMSTSGCLSGNGDDDNGSEEKGSDTQKISNGCKNLAQYCLSESPFSYYIESEAHCREVFECTYDVYSGSCRSKLMNILDCGEEVSSQDDCEPCGELTEEIQDACTYPKDCF